MKDGPCRRNLVRRDGLVGDGLVPLLLFLQLFPLTAGLLSRLPGREHYSFISFWWHDAQWQQINHGIFENKMMSGYFFCRNNMKKQFPWALVVSAMHIKFMDSKHLIANRYARVLVPALELKAFITLL